MRLRDDLQVLVLEPHLAGVITSTRTSRTSCQ
jgi:hypothetical protein